MHLKLLKNSRAWIFMLRAWTKHASLVTVNPKPLVELLKRKIPQFKWKQSNGLLWPFTLCIKIYEEREVLKFVATFIDWKGYLVHEFG
jgi:hypothetical protein